METIGLLNKLNNIAFLHDGLQEAIKSCLIEETFPRKTVLLKAGQVAQRIYFIKKGLSAPIIPKVKMSFRPDLWARVNLFFLFTLGDILKFKDAHKE